MYRFLSVRSVSVYVNIISVFVMADATYRMTWKEENKFNVKIINDGYIYNPIIICKIHTNII